MQPPFLQFTDYLAKTVTRANHLNRIVGNQQKAGTAAVERCFKRKGMKQLTSALFQMPSFSLLARGMRYKHRKTQPLYFLFNHFFFKTLSCRCFAYPICNECDFTFQYRKIWGGFGPQMADWLLLSHKPIGVCISQVCDFESCLR